MMRFSGTGTALITPFKNGEVDYGSLERMIAFQIEGGVDFLVVLGTTGEAPAVTMREREEIVRFAVRAAGGRVPVVAGTGSNSTVTALELARQAISSGADGLLVVTPYYNKPPQEGLYEHFKTVASGAGGVPLVIYNVPGRTGVNILPETVMRLAEIENIAGIKEASGDQAQVDILIRRVRNERPDFAILSGNDDQAFHVTCAGGDGVISVLSNAAPDKVSDMIRHCLAGHLDKARDLHLLLFPLMKGLFCETNPIPVKYAASRLGLCANEVRLPLVPASAKAMETVERAMKESGILL